MHSRNYFLGSTGLPSLQNLQGATMVKKIPTNRNATSRIGNQLKPLASRCSVAVVLRLRTPIITIRASGEATDN